MTLPVPPATTTGARVLYLTREGCHLCEEALPTVREIADGAGAQVEVRDIDDDPDLAAAWNDHVPVVVVDGTVHARYTVDPASLRAALRPRPWWRRLIPR